MTLVIAAAVVTVGVGVIRSGLESAPVETIPGAAPTAAPAALYVHVSGEVREPGLYRLDEGARVVDAVSAAGGFTEKAAPEGVNLARAVTDGEQLIVPPAGAAGEDTPAGAGSAPSDGRVNLNTADVAALDTLPRVGPAIAQRIIDWRDQNGRFTSVDDLMAVPGIGEKMLASLRDLVTV